MPFLYFGGGNIFIEDCSNQKKVISDIGGSYDPIDQIWVVIFTVYNLNYLTRHLENLSVAEDIDRRLEEQKIKEARLDHFREMSKGDVQVRFKVPGLRLSLYNYQRLGVMYSITNGAGTLIADEMGLGKTLQSIATALFLKSKGMADNALLITPASLKFNWPLEIEKFTDEKYVVIDGNADQRVAQWLRDDVFFYVVNYELILEDLFGGRELKKPERKENDDGTKEDLVDFSKRVDKWEARVLEMKRRQRILGPVRRRMWDFISIDECHHIKNHDSKRAKNIKSLRSRFRMALSGTPLDGRLEEIHSIMGFVAPGLLGSKTRFFQRHVEADYWGKIVGYKRMSEVKQRIAPFFIRRLKKDVLKDLPDKIYENIPVILTPAERKIYKSLAERGHEATEDSEAVVTIIRCKQFCNYPQMVDENCKRTSKLDTLRGVLDEIVIQNGNKAIMFSQYKEMLNILVSVLDDMGIKYLRIDGDTPKKLRADMQKTFKEDKSVDMMVGTDAMSTGLNLQAANYVINYDDLWSPSIMAQREDRTHRIGQKFVVTVINFICKDTIEERIREAISEKNRVSSEVLGDNADEMIIQRLGPKDMAKLL